VGDGYDQVADLLGPGYHVAHQAIGLVGDGNHGASIASRWPLGDVREADLHLTLRTGDYPCGTLAAEVLVPEPVGSLLFVAHGPSHQLGYEFQRERQSLAAARLVEGLVGRLGTRHAVVAATSTRTPTPTAWRSGAADGPWRARACATGTHGKARARGRPATRSRRPTRSWPRTSAPSTAADGSTTSSCAATIPYTGPHSTSAPAPSPSTNLSEACGQATTSASLPSSRFPTFASERIGSGTLGKLPRRMFLSVSSRNQSSRRPQ
jgi:hypothetical protein